MIKTGNTSQQYLFEGAKSNVQDAIKNNKEYKQGNIRGKKMTFKSNTLAKLCGELSRLETQYN